MAMSPPNGVCRRRDLGDRPRTTDRLSTGWPIGAMPPDDELRISVERARQAFRTASDGRPPATQRTEDERTLAPGRPAGLHPFFRGLLDTLPEPGSNWPQSKRDQWLETARNIFALLYADIEERQPLPFPQRDSYPQQPDRRIA